MAIEQQLLVYRGVDENTTHYSVTKNQTNILSNVQLASLPNNLIFWAIQSLVENKVIHVVLNLFE